jgi:hypothetical protein
VTSNPISAIYLEAGAISINSSAFMSLERLSPQKNFNSEKIVGLVKIVDGTTQEEYAIFLIETQGEEILGPADIVSSKQIPSGRWCLVFITAQGSVEQVDGQTQVTNGCLASVLGLRIVYE